MNASDLFKAGKLTEAIEAQIKEVKTNPGDQAKRLFLFEMVAFSGDLDRARKQIEALKYDEIELQTALVGYRLVLESEAKRRRLFTESLKPEFLTPPPDHVNWRLEAVNRLREGNFKEANDQLQAANAAAPLLKGKINGKPFEGIRDCDDLFGTVLEVFAQGNYYWVPLDQVEMIAMTKPRFPRDVLWMPARLELPDSKGDVFLPNLYYGSHQQTDPVIQLGRFTDWKQTEGGTTQGMGAKLFLVGDDSMPMLEWRNLQIGEEG